MAYNITTKEFIQGVINDDYDINDIINYCKYIPNLGEFFKSLYKASSGLLTAKGVYGYVWSLSNKRFEFDNPTDLRIYTNDDFVRLQNAMEIVCNQIDLQDNEKQAQDNEASPLCIFLNKVPENKRGEAEKYLNKAIELALITQKHEWTKGKELLSWFVVEFSRKCNMGKGVNRNDQPRISWQPFETLFNIRGLRNNYNDTQKTGRDPIDKELIDRVFE